MEKHFDLIVAGAGWAGSAAAIAAGRKGLRVLIIDKNNCPGGAAASCLVMPFMRFWTLDPVTEEKHFLARGIFEELGKKLEACGAMPDQRKFNEEYVKLFLEEMLLDAGVTLLYESYLVGAKTEGGRVTGVTVANKSGLTEFTADYFIDGTGDGDLCVMAGCHARLGRESDSLCQPMSLMFRMCNVDTDLFMQEKPAIQEKYKEYQAAGKITNCRENVLTFLTPIPGIVHFNTTRVVKLNPVNGEDVTRANIEARRQIFELIAMLKENFESFKNAELMTSALQMGVRESRMIDGDYILTQEDLLALRRFDDSIAVCNYDIDIHNPEGTGTSHHYFAPGEYYTIPYRCLTPLGKDNLWVAGRCISSTHEAQASYRIMPICCTIGQAAGTAAALACKGKCTSRQISIPELQKDLEAQNLRIR